MCGCPYATCGRGTACMRAAQSSAASMAASAPSEQHGYWSGARAGMSSERSARPLPARVRAASGPALVIRPPRPRGQLASSASSESPVGGHHSGGRRAGGLHATNVHPRATTAYAIAAAAAVPPLPLQPLPITPAAGAQARGSTGLTVLRLCHRTVSGPADVSGPLGDGKEEKSHINRPPPFPPSGLSLG
jgi:hypothetical protein